MLVKRALWLGAAALASCQQTGVHTDWPRWCGKVYESGYPSFDPTGQTLPPTPVSGPPLLHVQFRPRYSIYLESDATGEFIVNAPFSRYHGASWPPNSTTAGNYVFSINLTYNDEPLVENSVAVNSTNNIFAFDLSKLTPRLDPYEVVIYGGAEGGEATASSTAELYYLPEKTNGSITRVDNLSGGLYFRNAASGHVFKPLLSYGFFASYDGFLGENDTNLIQHYADLGLNGMAPLTQFPEGAVALDYMDKIDLKWMYDLREGYKNLTWVEEKVLPARDHDGLYSYWLSDEPDGWQDPFNATVLGARLLKKLDPYHPLAVVLNCQNYYFGEYTVAADIIMEDVYPIGINSTFSKWGTVCNTTLGDCGCDNCKGNVQDVPNRLDDLMKYEEYLGRWPKPKMHCPQSFHGEDYWFRDPTVEEEFVMNTLAFNHGAKSIVSWVYPASDILSEAHGTFARVVTQSPVVEFLVGASFQKIEVTLQDYDVVDASLWVVGDQILVSIVNGGYVDIDEPVAIPVLNATSIVSMPWGNVTWELVDQELRVTSLPALATSILILSH